jgi:hypothetical protein
MLRAVFKRLARLDKALFLNRGAWFIFRSVEVDFRGNVDFVKLLEGITILVDLHPLI